MTDITQTLGFWLEVAGIFGAVIGATTSGVTWFIGRTLVSKHAFDAYQRSHADTHEQLDIRLSRGGNEFADLHAELKHRPGMTDLGGLRESIAELEVEVARLTESRAHVGERISELSDSIGRRLDRVEEQVERLIDFLMKERAN